MNNKIDIIIDNIIDNNIKDEKSIKFKEFCIQRRIEYKLKTTKLPKYIPFTY